MTGWQGVKKSFVLSSAVLALILSVPVGVVLAADAPAVPPAIGLSVEPGGLLIQGVEPGQVYDLEEKTGILLTIHNRDRSDHTYMLATFRPSEVGNRRLPLGYEDIGDPAWFWFEQSEVRVPGQESAQVRMYLRVPDDDRYWNQHWSVSVGVAGKAEPGETLTLAVYPRFEIETAAAGRAELSLRPAGETGLCPTVVDLGEAGEEQTLGGEFMLCNNDEKTHRYRLAVAKDGDIGEGKQVFPSGGSTWISDPAWIALPRPRLRPDTRWSGREWPTLWLARRSHVPIPVVLKIPAGISVPEGGGEAIISVEREDGETSFVRARLSGSHHGE